jgi:hypothetical protein
MKTTLMIQKASLTRLLGCRGPASSVPWPAEAERRAPSTLNCPAPPCLRRGPASYNERGIRAMPGTS